MECGRIERLRTQRGERATPRVPIPRIGRTAESHRVDQHPRDPSARSDRDPGRAGVALGESDIDLGDPIARQDEPLSPGDSWAGPRSVTRPGLMSQALAVATPSGRVGGEPPSRGVPPPGRGSRRGRRAGEVPTAAGRSARRWSPPRAPRRRTEPDPPAGLARAFTVQHDPVVHQVGADHRKVPRPLDQAGDRAEQRAFSPAQHLVRAERRIGDRLAGPIGPGVLPPL